MALASESRNIPLKSVPAEAILLSGFGSIGGNTVGASRPFIESANSSALFTSLPDSCIYQLESIASFAAVSKFLFFNASQVFSKALGFTSLFHQFTPN